VISHFILVNSTEKNNNIQRGNKVLLDHLIEITRRGNQYIKTEPEKPEGSPNRSKRDYLKKLEQSRIQYENDIMARKLLRQ
jgi:hypothetical protein